MNAFWSYFWPVATIGLVIGLIAGTAGFRAPRPKTKEQALEKPRLTDRWRKRRRYALAIGAALSIAAAALWHGPIGAADRFTSQVERNARQALDYYEMAKVTAHLHRGPLTRRLVLTGRVDDWQSGEMVRLFSQLPGVSKAQWTSSPAGPPLLLEGSAVSVLGFLLGLLLAYLVELRRRYNAQWSW